MTVLIRTAEAASVKKRDPQKYKWYQLAKGKASFDSANEDFELELRRGEKFGLKFYRGSYFLVDEDDLSVQFKLSVEEGKKLIAASKPYAGEIAGKPVNPGKTKKPEAPKPTQKLPQSRKSHSPEPEQLSPVHEAKRIATKLLGTSKAVQLNMDGSAQFFKKGGHAGAKQLDKIVERAKNAGFKKTKSSQHNPPDGSTVGEDQVYKDKQGNVLTVHKLLGSSPFSNSFEVTFVPSSDLAKAISNHHSQERKKRSQKRLTDPHAKKIRELEDKFSEQRNKVELLLEELMGLEEAGVPTRDPKYKKVKSQLTQAKRAVNGLSRSLDSMRKKS